MAGKKVGVSLENNEDLIRQRRVTTSFLLKTTLSEMQSGRFCMISSKKYEVYLPLNQRNLIYLVAENNVKIICSFVFSNLKMTIIYFLNHIPKFDIEHV